MEYFAGMFDADGWVTLCAAGSFNIGIEKHNEQIINLFQSTFGGHVHVNKRKGRKTTYTWYPSAANEGREQFAEAILPYTKVKTEQLQQIRRYLNQTRSERTDSRREYIHKLSGLKQPTPYTREQIKVPTTIKPDESFFKWFAGFMDGDGNFAVYDYENWGKRTFDSWIGAFNIFGEPIIYIKERLEGSISQYKGCKNRIWKWVCSQGSSQFVCDSLYPHLHNRKEQCRLVGEYLKIHTAKIKGVDYSDETVAVIRDIIKQIKYHNSL